MWKNSYRRKIVVFIGAVLCAGNVIDCSAAMEHLADGTDNVLGGLADGTDTMLNGLAEGTGQMFDVLSEADDGRLKDRVLDAFGMFVDEAGTAALTPENELKGRLEKGVDDYTGSYEATYSDFTGTEILFGGTALEREAGNTLSITCSLSIEDGRAAIFLCSGAEDPVLLLSQSGDYAGTVEVDGASTYIGVWGENADGSVSIVAG